MIKKSVKADTCNGDGDGDRDGFDPPHLIETCEISA